MLVYYPELLMRGEWPAILLAVVSATIGTVAIAGALQGWCGWSLGVLERLIPGGGALGVVSNDVVLTCVWLGLLITALLSGRYRSGKSTAARVN